MAGMPVLDALGREPESPASRALRDRTLVALYVGDRYGIGPELVAALLSERAATAHCRLLVVGDPAVFARGQRSAGVALSLPEVASPADAAACAKPVVFLPRPFAAELLPLGRVTEPSGREILATLHAMAEAARDGHLQGLVYAPLNKQAMKLAGHATGDEFDVLA
ncbi:MAG: 4-hydroxythreonine-4-phosphate dehydrogenase PdxA, partial [Acetobacteraceae bacterium]